ncbi:fluoride efflux transporter CrcB [Isoptericola jiangsuensis]|uniref:fluoride efflux transporter CrcB n=1 Tax=Isoptericola jiangsuensis TaxID=548579 RepID=UPI003AAEB815
MSGLLGAVLVGVGGGLGAAARFWVADSIKALRPDGFPWGTWVVNAVGSLLIGLATGWIVLAGAAHEWQLLLVVGFCGGLTTFSTAVVETVTILRDGRHRYAVVHALSTLLVSVAAVVVGLWLADALLGRLS